MKHSSSIKGMLLVPLFVLCFFLGSWKNYSVDAMSEQQQDEVAAYHLKQQLRKPYPALPDGLFEYKGTLWLNQPNRNDDLSLISQGIGDQWFPISLTMKRVNGKVTGKSTIKKQDGSQICNFTFTGDSLENNSIVFTESMTTKCDKSAEWFEKTYDIALGPKDNTTLWGHWNKCGGLDKRCQFGGYLRLDLNKTVSKKEETKVLDETIRLKSLIGKSFKGTLWDYFPYVDDSGKAIEKTEGKQYGFALNFESFNEEDQSILIKSGIVETEYSKGDLSGHMVLENGYLIVTETDFVGNSTNWLFKTYRFKLDDLLQGSASSPWKATGSNNGGFLKLNSN